MNLIGRLRLDSTLVCFSEVNFGGARPADEDFFSDPCSILSRSLLGKFHTATSTIVHQSFHTGSAQLVPEPHLDPSGFLLPQHSHGTKKNRSERLGLKARSKVLKED